MDTFYVFLCFEVHFIHYMVKCCIIFTQIYNYLLRYFLYLYLILQVWHDQDSLLKRVNMHAIVDIGEMYPVVIHHCHMYLQPHHPVSLMSFSAHSEAHQRPPVEIHQQEHTHKSDIECYPHHFGRWTSWWTQQH